QIHRQIEMHVDDPVRMQSIDSFFNGFFHWDSSSRFDQGLLKEACVVVRLEDTPKAATFITIITSAKRYNPIKIPMAACIAKIQVSQMKRVFLIQMKIG